jgi:transposase, IS605 OrfB family, central region
MGMKRANMLDYEFHCISKTIVRICLENDIGNIVVGHNKNWKQESGMGRKCNQKFVSIPFNDLIWKIRYKAEEAGIRFVETEEGYTSKVDHCVGEEMRHQENYLGKRTRRGLFESSSGKILNADINGAIGILRKANALRDSDLVGLPDRGDVVSPKVLRYKP